MRLQISDDAYAQLKERMHWWAENRPDARVSVDEAFEDTMKQVLMNPQIGQIHRGDPRFRTIRLHKSMPYYAIYFVDEAGQCVDVDLVWSNVQGQEPSLPFRP